MANPTSVAMHAIHNPKSKEQTLHRSGKA